MNEKDLIHFTDDGEGPVLVLVHGFGESLNMWLGIKEALSENFRVIAVDLPGFGKSSLEKENPQIEYFAEELHKVLSHLSIEKSVVIGHSMGGYVALALAEKYEEQLLGLGLFHSSSYADTEEKRTNRDKSVDFLNNYGTEKYTAALIPNLFAPQHRDRCRKQIEFLLEDISTTAPKHLINAILAMKNRKDRSQVLKDLSCPVLFIAGKQDQVIPYQDVLTQSGLPGDSVLYLQEDIGHMGMFEATHKSLKALHSFMEYCMAIEEK